MGTETSVKAGNVTEDSSPTGHHEEGAIEALPIHLVDLGKARAKAIKQLKKGGGKLHQAVLDALGEVEFALGEDATGKTILPVVVVVEKKRKRQSRLPFSILR